MFGGRGSISSAVSSLGKPIGGSGTNGLLSIGGSGTAGLLSIGGSGTAGRS
jgi:hypothetical protein